MGDLVPGRECGRALRRGAREEVHLVHVISMVYSVWCMLYEEVYLVNRVVEPLPPVDLQVLCG
jgi:hypothetical protein